MRFKPFDLYGVVVCTVVWISRKLFRIRLSGFLKRLVILALYRKTLVLVRLTPKLGVLRLLFNISALEPFKPIVHHGFNRLNRLIFKPCHEPPESRSWCSLPSKPHHLRHQQRCTPQRCTDHIPISYYTPHFPLCTHRSLGPWYPRWGR